MRQTRAPHPRGVYSHICTIPKDFDQIEEAECECVRQITHGHTFQANDATATKCADGKLYSL